MQYLLMKKYALVLISMFLLFAISTSSVISATMAKGVVSWTNPPDNKGKIVRTDDGTSNEYEYNVNAGDTVGGYIPRVGDIVTFTPIETPSRRATYVQEATLPLGILNFQAVRNSDGSHFLYWSTQGASAAIIMPGNIDVSDKLPDGSITITSPTATTYTLTVYDTAGNSNSASDTV